GAGASAETVVGIGVDATGTAALGNNPGIFIGGVSFCRIGGTAPGEGNVISGNRGAGIAVAGYEPGNLILGNLIGVTPDGTQPLGNAIGIGLHVNVHRHFVGGATPAERNVIGGNQIGVHVSVAGTEHNWILGNAIGTDATGTLRLGNHEAGVLLEDAAARILIQGNTIAYNGNQDAPRKAGIYIARSPENTIRRNSIHTNVGPGIHLAEGGNNLLPAPVILTVTETTISGTACPGCTVEIFSDDEDEGRVYEGSTVADAAGAFTFVKPAGLSGPHVTATVTDSDGNTSEFATPGIVWRSICLPVILKGW
ncbi:MAG: NosD domain-containing protein, partial [Anaerolineae bacterium]